MKQQDFRELIIKASSTLSKAAGFLEAKPLNRRRPFRIAQKCSSFCVNCFINYNIKLRYVYKKHIFIFLICLFSSKQTLYPLFVTASCRAINISGHGFFASLAPYWIPDRAGHRAASLTPNICHLLKISSRWQMGSA